MLLGAVLRVWQYLANSSLWIDEIALARNIIDRPLAALWAPLDYAQVAPVGFLFVEKGITSLFGASEFALRAFPLVCGLASLFLFWAVARRVLSGWAVPFAVGLFSLGIPFIYFSSQVKQYSSDVAAALLLLLAALDMRRRGVSPRRAFWLGIAGAVIAWFSQAALVVMAGIGAGLLILVLTERDRAAARLLSITWTFWAASAAAVAAHSLWSVPELDRDYFRWFWSDGFMPMPPQSASDLLWVFKKLTWAFGTFGTGMGQLHGGLNYRWSPIFMIVMLAGLWALWNSRRGRDIALFIVLPIGITVIASAFKVYPFTARLFTFLLPSLLLATAAGANFLLSAWPQRLGFLIPAVLALLGGAPIYAAATALPPYWLQHVRPVIEGANARRSPSDGVYVYYGAGPAFHYYANRYHLSMDDVVMGRCYSGTPREYLRELDYFRGKNRLWVVVTASGRDGTEVALMLEYLDRLGQRLETIAVPGSSGRVVESAYGYLYDLSDFKRSGSVSSSTFPIAPSRATDPAGPWSCYGIFRPEPKTQ